MAGHKGNSGVIQRRKTSRRVKADKVRPKLRFDSLEDRLVPTTGVTFFGNRTTVDSITHDVTGDGVQDSILAVGAKFSVIDGVSGGTLTTFTAFESTKKDKGKLTFWMADTVGGPQADLQVQARINGAEHSKTYDLSDLFNPPPPPPPAGGPGGTIQTSGPVGEGAAATVSFTQVNDPLGRGVTFSYDFDNNGTFEIVGTAERTVAFPTEFVADGLRELTVRARVTDADGRSGEAFATLRVNNVAPSAQISGPSMAPQHQAVTFTASAADPGPVDQAAGLTYAWNFGDGQTATGASASHAYMELGTYTVTLVVTDKDGASTRVTRSITIADHNSDSGVIVTPDWIYTHHGKLPNFGGYPTITTVQAGNWSDPATWGGRLPAANDIVAIDKMVVYDQLSDVKYDTVTVLDGGMLHFRTDASTRLRVTNFLVLEGGHLMVGTQADPVRAGVKAEVIINNLPIDTTKDPEQYGHGLIAFGKVSMHGAVLSDTWIRLAAEPKAGDTTLRLSAPVTGWKAGDRIVMPDSRQLNDFVTALRTTANYVPMRELLTVASVSQDGLTVTLSAPLAYTHPGARDADGQLTFLPHVANLTRNVVVRSESATGVRGHTMYMARADVDIRFSQFSGLGRSTVSAWDNTTFDSGGSPTRIGTNQMGRYSVHFHHLVGPAAAQPNGYQYTFEGNSVFCPVDPMPFRWGITVHDSHYGLVKDNVLYNWAGAGIMLEDGSESYNVVDGNFITRISSHDGSMSLRADTRMASYDFGNEGSGIWSRGPNNYIRNNVVSETPSAGFTYYQFMPGWSNRKIPAFQGADTHHDGQSVIMDVNRTPLLQFEGNESYGGLTGDGLTVWSLGTNADVMFTGTRESVVKNFNVWHVTRAGFYPYENDRLTLDGFKFRGDVSMFYRTIELPTGIALVDYLTKDFVIRNSDIQGAGAGWGPSTTTGGGTQTMENTILRNYTNIALIHLYRNGHTANWLPPRTVILRNVQFGQLNLPTSNYFGPQRNIVLSEGTSKQVTNFIQRDQLFIYDYNGIAGNNFRVYYTDQAPTAIVPQTKYDEYGGENITGAPVAGLTNLQAWSQYGIAVAGEIAPADAEVWNLIHGLVKRI